MWTSRTVSTWTSSTWLTKLSRKWSSRTPSSLLPKTLLLAAVAHPYHPSRLSSRHSCTNRSPALQYPSRAPQPAPILNKCFRRRHSIFRRSSRCLWVVPAAAVLAVINKMRMWRRPQSASEMTENDTVLGEVINKI